MARQHALVRMFAGLFTVVGLGLVWLTIIFSLPSQQELSAREPLLSKRAIHPPATHASSEPALDLSIPGAPSGAPPSSIQPQVDGSSPAPSTTAQVSPRGAQIAQLRCEAEIAEVCPDSAEGPGRKHCLERHAQKLSPPCQQQIRERFVKWKEERNRLVAACQTDARRWCTSVKPGEGRLLQCLQDHAQDLSDRCYETLPKGTLYFAQ